MLAQIINFILTFKVGLATTFSAYNDPYNPSPYAACLHRNLKDTDVIVAHKTLPCGSSVWIYNLRTKRGVVARVGDRGPRRAMVDLNIATARAVKANGWETVLMVPR